MGAGRMWEPDDHSGRPPYNLDRYIFAPSSMPIDLFQMFSRKYIWALGHVYSSESLAEEKRQVRQEGSWRYDMTS